MRFTGYGYRKNCFGERMFFEDEMLVGSHSNILKFLSRSLTLAKKDDHFSFKFALESGECWAIECSDEDRNDGVFTVTFSRAWNDIDPEKKMSRKAITKWITDSLPPE